MKYLLILSLFFISCTKEAPNEPPEYIEIGQICIANEYGAIILSIKKRGCNSSSDLCANVRHQIADRIEIKRDRTHVRYYLQNISILYEYDIKETDEISYKL